jgi:hypothetical protein
MFPAFDFESHCPEIRLCAACFFMPEAIDGRTLRFHIFLLLHVFSWQTPSSEVSQSCSISTLLAAAERQAFGFEYGCLD